MKITIFTPTYNRAYIIHNLYASLQRQSFTDFEWLVIDDGSSDSTEELFAQWVKKETLFPIRYYKQPNGGKCRAINRALDLAEGELFFTVDSDDYLTDDALEKLARWEAELPKDEQFCGIAGNLGNELNYTKNRLFEHGYFEGTLLDRYKSIDGERAIAIYTEVHRKYRYPEFEGENFMTEAVAWNRMARDGYKMRFYNDIIWVYEYQPDGLTKAGNRLFLQNPRGYGLWLREKEEFLGSSGGQKLKLYYSFACEMAPYYDNRQIAEFIGTRAFIIRMCLALHKILSLIKGKKTGEIS